MADAFPVVALPGSEPASDNELIEASAEVLLPGDEPVQKKSVSASGKKSSRRRRSRRASKGNPGKESETESDSSSSDSDLDTKAALPGDLPASSSAQASAAYEPSAEDIASMRRLMASMQMEDRRSASSKYTSRDEKLVRTELEKLEASARAPRSKLAARSKYTARDEKLVLAELDKLEASARAPRAPRGSARQSKLEALQAELNAPRSAARTTVTKWSTQRSSGKSTSSSGGFPGAR